MYAGNALATVKSKDKMKVIFFSCVNDFPKIINVRFRMIFRLLSVRTTAFDKAAQSDGNAIVEEKSLSDIDAGILCHSAL